MACELPGAGAHVSSQHSISHFPSIVPLFFPLSSQMLLATRAVDVMTKIVLCCKRNTDYVRPVVSKSGITMRPITFMGGFDGGRRICVVYCKSCFEREQRHGEEGGEEGWGGEGGLKGGSSLENLHAMVTGVSHDHAPVAVDGDAATRAAELPVA